MSQVSLAKCASTALVRMIRRGILSPQTIERAAQGMSPGKFRFIKNLGRGQFNLADQVVGNVGGHAGEMVRKLPAHKYVNPKTSYRGLRDYVDMVNKNVPTDTGHPLIAPYVHVGSQGAFQRLGNQTLTHNKVLRPGQNTVDPSDLLPPQAREYLNDLHGGNLGPGGQVLDFLPKQPSRMITPPASTTRVSDAGRTPVPTWIPGGLDVLANTSSLTARQRRLSNHINTSIRAFYSPKNTPRMRRQVGGLLPTDVGSTAFSGMPPASSGPIANTSWFAKQQIGPWSANGVPAAGRPAPAVNTSWFARPAGPSSWPKFRKPTPQPGLLRRIADPFYAYGEFMRSPHVPTGAKVKLTGGIGAVGTGAGAAGYGEYKRRFGGK